MDAHQARADASRARRLPYKRRQRAVVLVAALSALWALPHLMLYAVPSTPCPDVECESVQTLTDRVTLLSVLVLVACVTAAVELGRRRARVRLAPPPGWAARSAGLASGA